MARFPSTLITASLVLATLISPALTGDASAQTVITEDYSADPAGSSRTLWGSLLDHGMDEGLVGTWHLDQAVLSAPQGVIQWPTAGHTMHVAADGTYRFDYGTAKFLTSMVVNGTTLPVPTPGMLAPFAPSGMPLGCLENGTISGLGVGRLFTPFAVSLDHVDAAGGHPIGLPWMEAVFNKAASQKPSMTCNGAGVKLSATTTLMPPGVGRPVSGENGMVVPYDYQMSPDRRVLAITSRDMPGLVYLFSRID